jgi:hypothetical protein
MNIWLAEVIACGIRHAWGSADMECYLDDRRAMERRLMDQYELKLGEAHWVAELVIGKSLLGMPGMSHRYSPRGDDGKTATA